MVKNKWARGIPPRYFSWIVRDQLAISERPGGYARNHRPVRRQEEILWLRESGFTMVVSLLPSTHNLHAYDNLDLPWSHVPFPPTTPAPEVLPAFYRQIDGWLGNRERVLVHMEELGDRLMGVMSGYLLHSGFPGSPAQAIGLVEQLVARQMGPDGRLIVNDMLAATDEGQAPA